VTVPGLIDSADGAIPVTCLTRDSLAAWRDGAPPATAAWLDAVGFTGEAGRHVLLPDGDGRLARVVVAIDAAEPLWAFGDLATALPEGSYRLDGVTDRATATQLATGWALGAYAFTRYKAAKRPPAMLVWPEAGDRAEIARVAEAIQLVRDLINTPAQDLAPDDLAAAAEALAARHGAAARVIRGEALLAENYPMIHAVGRGSARPPCLVDFRWGPADAPKVTLVGKGVCFDSGGYDLKPSAGMLLMKKDMGGAANVLGLAHLIMAAGRKVRLRVLVPAVENLVSGTAFKPKDVIRTRKGLTVEIGNTDAEGRLVLCDPLTEADSERPALIVDMATLTGAARVALGPELPAMFCNDDATAEAIQRAGVTVGDPLWRLPLWQPYRRLLDSPIADMNNVADGPFAGAITAALYLQAFVSPGTPWAHFDIYAWSNKRRPGRPEGGEAMAIRALDRMIAERFG